MSRCKQHGLSLLELLVVMVIASMVTALLTQGLGNALTLYSRVSSGHNIIVKKLMLREWVRSTLSNSVPAAIDSLKFSGSSDRVVFHSFAPLMGSHNTNTEQSWRVSCAVFCRLSYSEAGKEVFDIALQNINKSTFEYRDAEGDWHEQWPVDESNYLPSAVRWSMGQDNIVAVIRSHTNPHAYQDEVRFGRE